MQLHYIPICNNNAGPVQWPLAEEIETETKQNKDFLGVTTSVQR